MKVRIESDGDAMTTRIYNAETGEEIEGVVSVTWKVRYGEIASVLLEFDQPKINSIGELWVQQWMKT